MIILTLVSFVLMSWLLLAARSTDQFQYYVWSFIVPILWSQAAFERDPKKYGRPVQRITTALFVWVVMLMFILGVYYVVEHPEFLQNILEGGDATPTPTPEGAVRLMRSVLPVFSAFFP